MMNMGMVKSSSPIMLARTGIFHAQMRLLERIVNSGNESYTSNDKNIQLLQRRGLVVKVDRSEGYVGTTSGKSTLELYYHLNRLAPFQYH